MLPDNQHFGVFWMNHEALSIAYDLDGAFNDLAISLLRGASSARRHQACRRPDRDLTAVWALTIARISSRISFLTTKSSKIATWACSRRSLFLAVAAFLLNVVMTRTINTQREQIAALKAFGYSNLEVGGHYLKSVLLIVAGALAVGIPLGIWFGSVVTEMYAKLFHFPEFTFRIYPSVLLSAAGVAVAAAVLGTLGSVVRAVRLPPAEAMRPEPPTGYGPTLVRETGPGPSRAAGGADGAAAARAASTQDDAFDDRDCAGRLGAGAGNFMQDSVNYMMAAQFHWVQRYDMSVATTEAVADRAIYELDSMPGVIAVRTESQRLGATACRAAAASRRASWASAATPICSVW